MRLIRLTLDGYRRLALADVRRLDWTPTAPYQMILGTNGCGKSSLMAECSPLPASASDYLKGGSKRAEWEHEHIHYIVTSSFVAAARHSFVRDGVELNEGGTASIQKELVEAHFNGYTKDIHDILTGYETFTSMSPADRRKWITRMSHCDYTFALAFHDRVKSAARDVQGHLNRVKQRLYDETLTLSRMTDVEGLEDRVKGLQDDLSQLLYARIPSDIQCQPAIEAVGQRVLALERAGEALIKAANQIDPIGKDRSAQALERRVAILTNEIQIQGVALDRMRVEYSDLETMWQAMEATENVDVTTVDATIRDLTQRIAAARASVERFPEIMALANPSQTLATTEEILSRLMTLFVQIPDNSNRHIARAKVEAARATARQAQGNIDKAESSIRVLQTRLHVIDHAAFQTCPQCAHSWAPGVDTAEAPELRAKVEAWQSHAHEAARALQEANAYLEEAEAYMGVYRQWRGYIAQYPDLQVLWDHIQSQKYDIEQPGEHADVFTDWLAEIIAAANIKSWEVEVERLAAASRNHTGQGLHLQRRLQALEEDIGKRTAQKADLQRQIATLNFQRQLFQTLEETTQGWHTAVLGLENAYDQALEALAVSCIDRDVVRVQGQLGSLQHTLNAKQALLHVIEDLSKTLESASLDQAAMSLIAQELSPKEGLIAEQMHAFIIGWVAQINAFIRPIWTYDLEVLPCEMDKGDLTYRFPVYTSASEQRSVDVMATSTSIKQIINFAFQQTMILYLGLKDIPLFIDELGANFDVQHRLNLQPFLVRLMESQQYSQLFMISHYEAGWGAFNGAQYLVLDGRNIAVPDQHNQHVTLN